MTRHLATLALLSCVCVAAGTATSAHAITFVNQAPDTTTNFAAIHTSDFGSATQTQQGDVFSLSLSVEKINAVWYGGYISDDLFFARAPLTTDNFEVDFFAVSGGTVATSPVASFSGLDLAVTRTNTSITLPPDPSPPDLKFELYRYEASLDFTAINSVLPIGDYLFSVVNDSNGATDTNWYWLSSLQGDDLSKFRSAPPGNTNAWVNGTDNLAYTLTAPTPSTVSIFLVGLIFIGSIRYLSRKPSQVNGKE